ncbi:MAG: hypothetical protein CVV48_04700 [Spirochaetae bacterium HGW-Spirochaetae-4]|jgi:hypothetical protein|nr:MAG: hypothetical protein CVV48_04700 [Spirochaetae bacterium HGW-Spirochaetae-4]
MRYYYILFFISIILSPLLVFKKNNDLYGRILVSKRNIKKAYLFVVFTFISMLIGLRGIDVGKDTYAYIFHYFYEVKNNAVFRDSLEITINIIAWISLQFSSNYQLFLIINGVLIALLFSKFIFNNSENVFLSTVIFLGMFFIQSMNLMREWLAIGFGINALTLIRKGKKKSALLLILISISTHITAISLLLIPLLGIIKNKRKGLLIIFIFCASFFLAKDYILDMIVSAVPKYYGYVNNPYFLNEGGFNIKDLIFICIEIFYLYLIFFKTKVISVVDYNKYCENAALLLIAITFSLSGQKFGIVHRLVYYYSVFLIISLPEVIAKMKMKKLISAVLVVAMFVMLFRNSYFDNNGISNYYFFWQ